MKLYSISDEYINYLRKYDNKVYSNKEDSRIRTRKYLGVVLKINDYNYYIPLSSAKNSDYMNGSIRRSIVPIIRLISKDKEGKLELKGTLRLSNMIPVPESELTLYEPKLEKDTNYKIMVEKELDFIGKNEELIQKYASIIYSQKNNNYDVSYIQNVVNFKLLEDKCRTYRKSE